jgi:hypothetical protein
LNLLGALDGLAYSLHVILIEHLNTFMRMDLSVR